VISFKTLIVTKVNDLYTTIWDKGKRFH